MDSLVNDHALLPLDLHINDIIHMPCSHTGPTFRIELVGPNAHVLLMSLLVRLFVSVMLRSQPGACDGEVRSL